MKRFKSILLPVDFEAHSAEAVRLATDIARGNGSRVMVVHVYDPRGYSLVSGFVSYTSDELTRVVVGLKGKLEAIRRQMMDAGVSDVRTCLLEGSPAQEIASFAQAGEFDLIIMGTQGRTGIWKELVGSVAASVIAAAPCPVLTTSASHLVRASKPAEPERSLATPRSVG